MKNINKKYFYLLDQASKACGRKESISYFKRAAKLKSLLEEKLTA